jgi:LmbE family N-acetylglucosaminyl deacetylase
MAVVLHVSPHPDDEVIAAPATLIALGRAGHRVVNLACSLGRPGQHARRRAEVAEACRRAGFELLVHDPPLRISDGDDLDGAQRLLEATVRRLAAELGADLVVAPSPHDAHHGHEVVGRAVVTALARPGAPVLWQWGLWASLRAPTLYVPFGDDLLEAALHALRAHVGELARNDYTDLVRARAVAARVQGSEQVFGYGTPARRGPYAEVLAESAWVGGAWRRGTPRELDPALPLQPVGVP